MSPVLAGLALLFRGAALLISLQTAVVTRKCLACMADLKIVS